MVIGLLSAPSSAAKQERSAPHTSLAIHHTSRRTHAPNVRQESPRVSAHPSARFVVRPRTLSYQPTSPPMTASPEDMSWLIMSGTTPAVIGNSTGAVLTMRTTLPDPGVSRTQKKGRSRPSSV